MALEFYHDWDLTGSQSPVSPNLNSPSFALLESDSIWIKVNEYGNYKGPELYWQFSNGFTALIASKFEDEVTITILYSSVKSIEEYNKDREVSFENIF